MIVVNIEPEQIRRALRRINEMVSRSFTKDGYIRPQYLVPSQLNDLSDIMSRLDAALGHTEMVEASVRGSIAHWLDLAGWAVNEHNITACAKLITALVQDALWDSEIGSADVLQAREGK